MEKGTIQLPLKGEPRIDKESSLQLFPNPSTGVFYMKSEVEGKISVFNISHQVISTFSHTPVNSVSEIDLRQFQVGVYYVQFISKDGEVHREKIIKMD
jgi:hypothetical protein